MRVNHDALHCSLSIASGTACGFTIVIPWYDRTPAIRIKENLGRIEPQATSGIERARHSVGIDLARLHLWYENMPVVVGSVNREIERNHTCRLAVIFLVKKQEIYARGMTGVNAEVDASIGDCGSQRRALARRHIRVHFVLFSRTCSMRTPTDNCIKSEST